MGATDKVRSSLSFSIETMVVDFTDSGCKAQFAGDQLVHAWTCI